MHSFRSNLSDSCSQPYWLTRALWILTDLGSVLIWNMRFTFFNHISTNVFARKQFKTRTTMATVKVGTKFPRIALQLPRSVPKSSDPKLQKKKNENLLIPTIYSKDFRDAFPSLRESLSSYKNSKKKSRK